MDNRPIRLGIFVEHTSTPNNGKSCSTDTYQSNKPDNLDLEPVSSVFLLNQCHVINLTELNAQKATLSFVLNGKSCSTKSPSRIELCKVTENRAQLKVPVEWA